MSHTRYRVEAAGEPRDFPPRGDGADREDPEALPDEAGGPAAGALGRAGDAGAGSRRRRPRRSRGSSTCPRAHVDGVLTFYTMYNLRPVGQNLLQFCTSISCHLARRRGARRALPRSGSASASRRRRRTASSRSSRSSASPAATGRRRCMVNDTLLRADGRRRSSTRCSTGFGTGGLTCEKVLTARVGKPNSRSIDTLPRRRRLRGVRRRSSPDGWTPGAGHRRGQEVGPARPRRRGLPDRRQVGLPPEGHEGQAGLPRCCNADESEPGTFKDRLLMEQDPHQRDRGHASSPRTRSSAATAYIYIRGEFYDGARDPGRAPSTRRTRRGFLGENILGLGLRARHHRPPRRRRLHLRRGDRR